jgi:CRISPR-associated protein Csm4
MQMIKNKFSIYKLHFTAPLHLGDTRNDYSVSLKTICSDTMYAALTSCLAKTGKEIPEKGDLGFTISSLFPFYQKNEESEAVYFLPKPLRSVLPDLEQVEDAKKIKKVQWLGIEEFSEFINGNNHIFANLQNVKGEYLTKKEIDSDFISSQISPRVTVSRTGQEDATPFYMDRVYFKGYSGLYFIAVGADHLLNEAINVLQYEGVGTDRNVGNGFFTFSKNEIEIDCPGEKETAYGVALSMFIPESKEQLEGYLAGDKVGYDFARRGGWITTPPFNTFRKNAIYAFMHGSVLSLNPDNNIEIKGKIENLKPELTFAEQQLEHSIWRSGKSIFIPIKL